MKERRNFSRLLEILFIMIIPNLGLKISAVICLVAWLSLNGLQGSFLIAIAILAWWVSNRVAYWIYFQRDSDNEEN